MAEFEDETEDVVVFKNRDLGTTILLSPVQPEVRYPPVPRGLGTAGVGMLHYSGQLMIRLPDVTGMAGLTPIEDLRPAVKLAAGEIENFKKVLKTKARPRPRVETDY